MLYIQVEYGPNYLGHVVRNGRADNLLIYIHFSRLTGKAWSFEAIIHACRLFGRRQENRVFVHYSKKGSSMMWVFVRMPTFDA